MGEDETHYKVFKCPKYVGSMGILHAPREHPHDAALHKGITSKFSNEDEKDAIPSMHSNLSNQSFG